MKLSKHDEKIIILLAVWSAIDYCCLTGLQPKQFHRDFYNGLDEYEREIVDEFFNQHLTYLGNKFQKKEVIDKISNRFRNWGD